MCLAILLLTCCKCLIASYIGKDARKILSEESAQILESLINEKAAGPHSSHWATKVQPSLQLLVEVIRTFDIVTVRTMKLHLHPQWEGAINTFVTAYNTFSQSFIELFPRARNDDLMTPKIAYIQHEVVRWIKKFNRSLLYITEQAFEGVHYLFLDKEKCYKIPKTGEELLAGERRFTSDPAFGQKKRGKASKQNKNATKKRARGQESSSESGSSSTSDEDHVAKKSGHSVQSKTSADKVALARELLKQAVAAFNAENVLACGEGCYERMHEVLKFLESKQDQKNAPWKPDVYNAPKRKTKYEDDEDWEM